MQNALNPINKPVAYPRELFVDEKGKYAPGKIMTCQMGGGFHAANHPSMRTDCFR